MNDQESIVRLVRAFLYLRTLWLRCVGVVNHDPCKAHVSQLLRFHPDNEWAYNQVMNLVPLFALFISAVALTISILTYLRDRRKVRLVVMRDALILGSGKKEQHVSLSITNVGRRPLKVFTVGYRILWHPHQAMVLPNAINLPKKLDEGEDVACLFTRDILPDKSWKSVAYMFAVDTAGKEYKYFIAPAYKVWLFLLMGRATRPFVRFTYYMKHKNDN
ncbi:MAG: hypothetical protein JWP06_726 [Candidatus Saccharibacteria bacterium]|nr:hypothetical protein [Candidatus Saccharibacteria bacterium]